MLYYVELLDVYEETMTLGKLYPIDSQTEKFINKRGTPVDSTIMEIATGYRVEL